MDMPVYRPAALFPVVFPSIFMGGYVWSGWRLQNGVDEDNIRIVNECRALFSCLKILQKFSDSLLHRIFRRMHGVLNIDENKN